MNSINDLSTVSIQVIRLPQVRQMTGLCRSSIYQLEANEQFPKRVQIGPRSVGWVKHEIQGWLAIRIENRGRRVQA
ncbi:MAG: helix-turn-helix transcriptional regulator [Steroidobacteraceae bacterium]